MLVAQNYTDTSFYCPLCGLHGLFKRRTNSVSIMYCPACDREMMVLLDPLIEGEPSETKH
jgi:hypothetical protein